MTDCCVLLECDGAARFTTVPPAVASDVLPSVWETVIGVPASNALADSAADSAVVDTSGTIGVGSYGVESGIDCMTCPAAPSSVPAPACSGPLAIVAAEGGVIFVVFLLTALSLLIGVGSYGAERTAVEESGEAFSVSPPLLKAEGLVDACAAVLVVGVTIGGGSFGKWRSRGCADWGASAPFAVGFGTGLFAPGSIFPWTMGV